MIKVTKEQLDNKLFEMMHSLLGMYADAVDNNYSAKQIADISTKILEKTKSEFVEMSDTSDANLNIGCVSNCYMEDCLIQESCMSFKTKKCNKDCKLYQ